MRIFSLEFRSSHGPQQLKGERVSRSVSVPLSGGSDPELDKSARTPHRKRRKSSSVCPPVSISPGSSMDIARRTRVEENLRKSEALDL